MLSNRADLVSGGNALVEIKASGLIRRPVARRQDRRRRGQRQRGVRGSPDGRYYGLVTGLRNGTNVLTATTPGARARITITNHPIGGPVFSGAQVQPWTCTTKVASPTRTNPDLGDPLDAQCNIAAPVYRYQYRTLSNTFATYDPANPPPRARSPTSRPTKATPFRTSCASSAASSTAASTISPISRIRAPLSRVGSRGTRRRAGTTSCSGRSAPDVSTDARRGIPPVWSTTPRCVAASWSPRRT